MRGKYKYFLYFIFLLQSVNTSAQPYPYQHFTKADGLPSNTVYCVYKDHYGFLWFGTDMGIARYNGIHFDVFTTADGLADNEVFSFKEDFDGRLWIGTYNGELCYYKDGKFYTQKSTAFLRLPFRPFNITAMNMEADSSITMRFANKERIINIRGNKIVYYNISKIGDDDLQNLLFYEKNQAGKLELTCQTKFIVIDTQGNVSYRAIAGYSNYQYFFGYNQGFLLDGFNLFSTDRKLLIRDGFHYPVGTRMTAQAFILNIYYNKGQFFLCTRDGFFANNQVHLLQGKIITGVCEDLDGNTWFTSYKAGVFKFPNPSMNFKYYDTIYNSRILHSQKVNNSLYFYMSHSDSLYSFNYGKLEIRQHDLGYPPFPVEMERWAAFIVKKDSLMYFTYALRYNGIIAYNTIINNRHRKKVYKGWPKMIANLFENGHSIYGVDNRQIFKIDKTIKSDQNTGSVDIIFSSAGFERILGRAQDNRGVIWFSTNNAVYKLVDDKPVAQQDFSNLKFRKFGFFNKFLIGYDTKNNLFVCKERNGHYLIDTVKSEQDYIFNNLYPLDDNHVLLATNKYYQVLALQKERDKPYDLRPVLNPFIPLDAEIVYSDTANCYFFKDHSIISVKLSVLSGQVPAPKVLFTNFNTITGKRSISGRITIRQREANNIAIDFTSLSFSSKDIQYEYSVTGDPANVDWHATASTTISFPSLNYGQYFIKIRAKSPASDYSEVSMIELVVQPPFWLSWWFIVFAVLIFVVLLVVIVKLIIQRVLAKRKKEYDANMRYYGAEYKSLNALMNPHFIFNSLNNIQGLINRDDKKAANKFLMNFSTLVRQNMQNVSKGTVTLEEELHLIKNYLFLEKMRFDDLVKYTFEVDPEVETEVIDIPPLLIQPLVENAIKHGILPKHSTDGLVTIRVYNQGTEVIIDVIDNGVGYHFRQQSDDNNHKSFGLENLNKRTAYAQMLHKQHIVFSIQELKNAQGEVTGTIATLKIKMPL